MHPDMIEAAICRLEQLYFTDKLGQDTISQDLSSSKSKAILSSTILSTSEFHCLSQCIRVLLDFQDSHLFRVNTANRISFMLDFLAQTPFPDMCRYRFLSIAHNTLHHLPVGTEPPSIFYKTLIEHISRVKDISASENSEQLLLLISVLVTLKSYGGHEVLNQYLPVFSVVIANIPSRMQIEIAALLSMHPNARTELLPNIFQLITSHKKWTHQLTVRALRKLLEAMTRTQTRSSDLVTGIVRFIQSQRSAIEPDDLVRFMHSLVLLGFRDIDFFSSTTEHLLNAVSPVSRARASVHDLCEVLYTLTFVLKGVIRVVQQVLARLKISASQVTPRDITLLLYSFVKLRVARYQDISGPFCDQAVSILSSFKPQELASTLSSLRALNFNHTSLIMASYGVLLKEMSAREAPPKGDSNTNTVIHTDNVHLPKPDGWPHRLQDIQFISMTSAVIHLLHIGAEKQQENSKNRKETSPRENLDPTTHSQTVQHHKRGVDAVHSGITRPLCDVKLKDAFIQISTCVLSNLATQGALPKSSATRANPNGFIGLQLYLVITTLTMFDPPVKLSMRQWAMLAVLANANASQLQKGYATTEGSAAIEVLIALHKLRRMITPDLPNEEDLLQGWVAVVDSWSHMILPNLCNYVRDNFRTVLGDSKFKEDLKDIGLLTELSQSGGGVGSKSFSDKKIFSGTSSRRSSTRAASKAAALQDYGRINSPELFTIQDENDVSIDLPQPGRDAMRFGFTETPGGDTTPWSEDIAKSESQRLASKSTKNNFGVHVASPDGEVLELTDKEVRQRKKGAVETMHSFKKGRTNRSSNAKLVSNDSSEFLI
ncbi:unnamed protein product [Phytomonas sp. Hart1]|nr:unnamed protein product [Phytomonas sp. Hart1]|eukprot:CCW68420.1 unnamed protein product [Phytomonas sp. isolate Hart1]